MKLIYFFFLIALSSSVILNAQSLTIRVTDEAQKPVFGASVVLKLSSDSTKIWGSSTDTLGNVRVTVPESIYWLSISSLGYTPLRKVIKFTNNVVLLEYTLKEETTRLGEITVRAQKPLVRQEDDKTIVDPEPLAASSTSAYEVLEKTPGLFLDQDGNIYLSSTSPATVFINGREQKMSAADIASILKSLPPNSIEKMEIMRTPSAKYDASGSGGIVNVILKKGVKIGLTGSINTAINQGHFGAQSIGINLNNVVGSRSSYLNLSFNRRNSYDSLWSAREISPDLSLIQRAYTTTPSKSLYMGFGIGRELSKKLEINTDTRLSYNPYGTTTTNSNTQINPEKIAGLSTNTIANEAKAVSFEQGVSGKFKLDSLGSELTVDFSYNYFSRDNVQNFSTLFTLPQMLTLSGFGDISNTRNAGAGQIDLKYKFKHQVTLETGIKSTYQFFWSNTDYFSQQNQQITPDTRRSNTYQYRENINAAYLQGSKKMGEFLLKIGARIENTNMDGRQLTPTTSQFTVARTDLFPYMYLSRKVMKIAGYELRGYLIARRSITRPVYDYLNPSIRIIDQFLYETGNPTLKPQFTQTFEANISMEERPIFAIGRNYTQDIFTNVIYQDKENKAVTYRTYDNLGINQETYFRMMAGIPPMGKYFFVVGAQYNLNNYQGLYENSPLNFRRASWRLFTFQQFKFDNRSSLTLNGFMMINGQLQFYELSNFGAMNLSVNRTFLDRKLTITANMTDVLFTLPNEFTLQQGTIKAVGRRQSDTRRVGINLRYNFGIRKREERTNPFKFDNE